MQTVHGGDILALDGAVCVCAGVCRSALGATMRPVAVLRPLRAHTPEGHLRMSAEGFSYQ